MKNSIDKIFNDDIKEKRKTSSGIYSRTGKRGYVGKMRFPTDIMRGKNKKDYMGNGKVVVWNMYEDIMDYQYFKGLSQDEQKKVLDSLREKHTNKEIQNHWGIAAQTYYNLVSKLGIKKKEMGNITENLQLDEQELAKYSKQVISYDLFKKLVMDQKVNLFNSYLNDMSAQELADAWGVPVSNIYNYKSRFKKKATTGQVDTSKKPTKSAKATKSTKKKQTRKKKQEVAVVEGSDTKQEAAVIDFSNTKQDIPVDFIEAEQPINIHEAQIELPLNEIAAAAEVNKLEASAQQPQDLSRNFGTTLTLEGEYTKEEMKKKLLTLIELLEGDDRHYKMNVSFTEIN